MDEENQAEQTTSPAEETITPEPSQEKDPVETELEKVESAKRTRLEKLEYTKNRVEAQIAAEKAKSGVVDTDEDRPVTVRELKAMQTETAKDTALTLADEIENENERKLVRHHLENTIKPSGDAQTDLRNARLIVNAVKNGQIIEDTLRVTKARSVSSGTGAPPKEKQTTELTAEEKQIKQTFKLSDAEILAAREKDQPK